ncbi:NUDIX domain-containing protein [Phytoactinopolyspora halotolerans]|uniref:NUDIX domain-containing protein n=1 Tax=Phytoactinopolyspora halotolerans TaxID=1981512 RepID=A0A6L9S6G6_9ACTN|nr:NUDIX domain-containing protein [Phytoactinopolyspora halotolerans]NEE00669.1 NUDIX domain-containing protein [Phytoactinopolyspora halotolerans]
MTARTSAGLLLFRRTAADVEVLLGHMGGPFWARRDAGAWSVIKGEYDDGGEEPIAAARREFTEELGLPAPDLDTDAIELGDVRQSSGKIVTAWAVEADLDPEQITPGTFEMEWPRGSGRIREFPEIDRVEWFRFDTARNKIITAQQAFLDRLEHVLQA